MNEESKDHELHSIMWSGSVSMPQIEPCPLPPLHPDPSRYNETMRLMMALLPVILAGLLLIGVAWQHRSEKTAKSDKSMEQVERSVCPC